ncbi:leucine-rich repeat domain-containing protein [Caldibacillus thermoamylovorans]
MKKQLLWVFPFVLFFLFACMAEPSLAAKKELTNQEIMNRSRAKFNLWDKDGRLYKAYLYSSSEKASYKTQNKKKYRVYTGTYMLALFDQANRKKLSTINTNIKTYSSVPILNTGTLKVFPHKKNQPSLIGIKEEILPPVKKLIDFDTLYYVHKGKLLKARVKMDQEDITFLNHDKLLNNKANQFTGYMSIQGEGTIECKWLFKPGTGEMDVTSFRLIKLDGTIENYPIFSYVKEIQFKDKSLEKAVRKNLKKPTGSLTLRDLDTLKSLQAEYFGITDLSGLEYARNLENVNLSHNGLDENDFWVFNWKSKMKQLDVSANRIKKIDFLYGMNNLTHLNIGDNAITDIRPLSTLSNLKDLSLYATDVKDLTPIAHLNRLVALDISGTDVTDFLPVKGLTSLETLWMERVDVDSFTFLSKLTNLKTLNINDTFYGTDDRIDGSPLSHLKRLENLYMNRVFFKNFTFLQSMKKLKKLIAPFSNVSTNDVKTNIALEHLEIQTADLSGLAHLTNLKYLDISGGGVSNIEPLSKLANLTALDASSNKIEDITPISQLPKLERLNLHDNYIESLPILKLPSLTSLDISNNLLTDIQPLESLTKLKVLSIAGNHIRDFTPLRKLRLEKLDVSEEGKSSTSLIKDKELERVLREVLNKPTGEITENDLGRIKELSILQEDVHSLEGLQYAKNLTSLRISFTSISDLSPLRNLTKLVSLDLRNNKIKEIEALSQLVNLEELDLSYNRIEQIDPLATLTKLKKLTLSGNKISNIEAFANLKNLQILSLNQNQIRHVDALNQLFMLKELDLGSNQIQEISFERLEMMECLYLNDNPLHSIASLSNMKNLEVLYFNGTEVDDISVLSKLKKLKLVSFTMSSDPSENQIVNELLNRGVTIYINDILFSLER